MKKSQSKKVDCDPKIESQSLKVDCEEKPTKGKLVEEISAHEGDSRFDEARMNGLVIDVRGLKLFQQGVLSKQRVEIKCIDMLMAIYVYPNDEHRSFFNTVWESKCVTCGAVTTFRKSLKDNALSVTNDFKPHCIVCYLQTPLGKKYMANKKRREELKKKRLKEEGVSSKSTTVNKKKSVAGIKTKRKNQRVEK